ncbi:chorismate mutase [Streptomyces sp. NPDC003703]|uniref:chorismate mutase n=1 Tax=Streptomyces sp. NPDC003283 TaxID=3364681 RepID=UPI0036B947DC
MNLRDSTTRCAVVTAMCAALALPTTHQATAASARTTAGPLGAPLGRLGPLTDLVIERIRVGDDVAAAKFGTGAPIEDPVREGQVLDQVRAQAGAAGLDPEAAVAFFRDQITASKITQRGLFARWTAHPGEAPATRPDLGPIRERLDRLTRALLDKLKDTERWRAEPVGCAAGLALAGATGAALEHLDALHRRALRTATRSVCQ